MTEIHWFDLFREYYGVALDADRATLWVKEMSTTVKKITEAELCDVIRWARAKREAEVFSRPPTLEVLIRWIKWFRKEKATGRESGDWKRTYQDIKQDMVDAKDPVERWDILCSCKDVKMCERLDDWARDLWPGFGPPGLAPIPKAIGKNVAKEGELCRPS